MQPFEASMRPIAPTFQGRHEVLAAVGQPLRVLDAALVVARAVRQIESPLDMTTLVPRLVGVADAPSETG